MARSPGAGTWGVDLSKEVVAWYATLGVKDRAVADHALDRLARLGPGVRMPHGRALGDGLHELRFTCEGVSRRVTYALGRDRQVAVLTTFRKQREREDHEIDRARRAKARARTREWTMERER